MDTGWLVAIALVLFDVFLALYANPLRNRKMISKLWNEPVELEGIDGKPIQLEVTDANGKVRTITPPLWLGITIGIGGHLKNSFYGTVGKKKQLMERQILEGMSPDQASWALALDQASKGKIGQAFISLMLPKVTQWVAGQVNQSGQAGQMQQRGGGGPI